jgi:spectinomycin phosphotransferase
MREPPDVPSDALLAALRDAYGLDATEAEFLPLGYDSAASVYRVRARDGRDYFLKLRAGSVNPAGLAVPRFLHAQGMAEVLAALPTRAGALWHALGAYALIVYPFIHDATPLPSGQANDHWRSFGAVLRRVHQAVLPPGVLELLERESFVPVAQALVARLDALVHTQAFDEPVSADVAEFWRAHAAPIRALLERVEALSQQLRQREPGPLCLCHADTHWDNVLVDAQDRLWLVDWDEALLAVKERDLMFVVGGHSANWATPRDTALFFEGYGPAAVDPLALAYYRADWALQDIGEFARQALGVDPSDVGDVTRRDAARLFKGLFGPGAIVEKALNSGVDNADAR